jgi:hypothetical protein
MKAQQSEIDVTAVARFPVLSMTTLTKHRLQFRSYYIKIFPESQEPKVSSHVPEGLSQVVGVRK